MRKLLLLTLLLFLTVGISFGQSIFTPEYSGDPSSHRTTEDPRINAVIGDYMGTTTGYPEPSAFAGQQALRILASPNGVGDTVHGVNPPRAVGVEDNGEIRASNIVARIRGEQNQPQAAPAQPKKK
jgi:hypothetical protein